MDWALLFPVLVRTKFKFESEDILYNMNIEIVRVIGEDGNSLVVW